jgi:F0F1-type ATP synthase epsilon subunit
MLILANAWGFLVAHRQLVLYIGLVVLIFIAALCVRFCGRSTPQLNQKEIIAAQEAIAEQDEKKMVEVLVSSDVREQQIDANVAEGRKQTVDAANESRDKWQNASREEVQAELCRRYGC